MVKVLRDRDLGGVGFSNKYRREVKLFFQALLVGLIPPMVILGIMIFLILVVEVIQTLIGI